MSELSGLDDHLLADSPDAFDDPDFDPDAEPDWESIAADRAEARRE